jgi:hypothetical protein
VLSRRRVNNLLIDFVSVCVCLCSFVAVRNVLSCRQMNNLLIDLFRFVFVFVLLLQSVE